MDATAVRTPGPVDRPSVCVVVPCYQPTLRPYEQLALRQCRSVLGAYDLAIVKPSALDLTDLATQYDIGRIESFPGHYFEGIAGYNQLMLADEFYARFAAYEFILIYQLDAFVFRDELAAWCAKPYDYIGAPWLPPRNVPARLEERLIKARQYLLRWSNRMAPGGGAIHGGQYMYAVGNGGFSLRRVSTMRSVLQRMPSAADRYRAIDGRTHYEDIFFTIEANRYLPRVRVPSFREAAGFAWELQPEQARALNHGKLPFGCHAWNKLHADEWRPVFAALGYRLDDLVRG